MPEEKFQAAIGPPDMGEYLRPQYANTVNVNFTPYDFKILFSLLTIPIAAPKGATPGKPVELHPVGVAEVVIPASVMHATIALLQRQFDLYLNQYGAPGMDPEGPRHD